MLIDCDGCAVRDLACGDCVVTVLLGAPPGGVEVDDGERLALDADSVAGQALLQKQLDIFLFAAGGIDIDHLPQQLAQALGIDRGPERIAGAAHGRFSPGFLARRPRLRVI